MSNRNESSAKLSSELSSTSVPKTAVPEPGPDWKTAKLEWGVAWEFHCYGLGVAFAFLAINSVAAMVLANKKKAFARRVFFDAINSLQVLFGMSRALCLLIDPYESKMNIANCPVWIARPLFGIAFPCLTSSFCLIHLAFLEVAKVQLVPPKIQNFKVVVSIIGLHFLVVIVSDTTVAFEGNLTELLIVCQSFFIVWGFLNSISFMYSGSKVVSQARKIQRQLLAIQQGENRKEAPKSNSSHVCSKTSKVAKITLATSALGVACCSLQVYSLFGVYGMYSKVVNPKPWPWLAFQTSFRLVELAMGCTIAYSVLQSADRGQHLLHLKSCFRSRVNRINIIPFNGNPIANTPC